MKFWLWFCHDSQVTFSDHGGPHWSVVNVYVLVRKNLINIQQEISVIADAVEMRVLSLNNEAIFIVAIRYDTHEWSQISRNVDWNGYKIWAKPFPIFSLEQNLSTHNNISGTHPSAYIY